MAITFSSICGEDENGKDYPISSNEPAISETVANLFDDVNGEEGVPLSTPVSVITVIMKSYACLYSISCSETSYVV